jgi:protein-S-isoprenylcysteine O-methyltransferase Ste14
VIPFAIVAATRGVDGAWLAGGSADLLRLAAGLALLVAGTALVAHSIRSFVRLGGGTLAPWDPTRALIETGAYRHSRNPMKGGLFLVLLAEALLLRSVPLLVWFACFAVANAVYIRVYEEPGLIARFGDEYRRYSERVPRWLPRLGAPRPASPAGERP